MNVYDKAIKEFRDLLSSGKSRPLAIYLAAKAFGLSSKELSAEMSRRAKLSKDAKEAREMRSVKKERSSKEPLSVGIKKPTTSKCLPVQMFLSLGYRF
jgi:protoporphyrinogen oxidase